MTEKQALQTELDRVRSELEARLQSTQAEVDRLQHQMQEREAGLGNAESQLQVLQASMDSLRSQLDNSQSQLHSANTTNTALLVCMLLQYKPHVAQCSMYTEASTP